MLKAGNRRIRLQNPIQPEKKLKLNEANIKKLINCVAETVAQRKVFSMSEGFAIDSNAQVRGYRDGRVGGQIWGRGIIEDAETFEELNNIHLRQLLDNCECRVDELYKEKNQSLFTKFINWFNNKLI